MSSQFRTLAQEAVKLGFRQNHKRQSHGLGSGLYELEKRSPNDSRGREGYVDDDVSRSCRKDARLQDAPPRRGRIRQMPTRGDELAADCRLSLSGCLRCFQESCRLQCSSRVACPRIKCVLCSHFLAVMKHKILMALLRADCSQGISKQNKASIRLESTKRRACKLRGCSPPSGHTNVANTPG